MIKANNTKEAVKSVPNTEKEAAENSKKSETTNLAPVVAAGTAQKSKDSKTVRDAAPVALKTFTVMVDGKEYTFFGEEEKLDEFKKSLESKYDMTPAEGSLENSDKFEIKPKEGAEKVDMEKALEKLSKESNISHFSKDKDGAITFENNTNPPQPILLVCMNEHGEVVGELNPKTGEFKYPKGGKEAADRFCELSGVKKINGKDLSMNQTEEDLSLKYKEVSNQTKTKIAAQKQAWEEMHRNAQPPLQTPENQKQEQVEQPTKENTTPKVEQPVKEDSEVVAKSSLDSFKKTRTDSTIASTPQSFPQAKSQKQADKERGSM